MSTAKQLYESLSSRPFSYGESVSLIIESRGKPISSHSFGTDEDFVFEDNSVIRVTNSGVRILEFLSE